MYNQSPIELTDGYKLDHRRQYPEETVLVYSNWTPRKSRIPNVNEVVVFGIQSFIKKFFIDEFGANFFGRDKAEIVGLYASRLQSYLGPNSIGTKHIEDLHDLGYLPIKIKALPEGSLCPIRVAMATVVNTVPEFFWLVNYFETLWSAEVWGACTAATIARQYRKIFEKYADITGADKGFIPYQGHDFSMRGMLGVAGAMITGPGHATSFIGSDTFPVIGWMDYYYNTDHTKETIIQSVSATEHAVMCVGTGFYIKKNNLDWEHYGEAEIDVFRRLITEVYPNGIISIVSDTWDLWVVLTRYMVDLKDVILARNGKLVIRPDSGDPADIVCGERLVTRDYRDIVEQEGLDTSHPKYKGVVELLWDTFGGTTNEKGFKRLDPHVGCIYGDSITLDRAEDICKRLADKGFESTSWVAGIGSYTYQYNTRDTLGFAMKATYAEATLGCNPNYCELPEDCKGDGTICTNAGETVAIEIFKDPITDDGTKKSARGLLQVVSETDHDNPSEPVYRMIDRVSWKQEEDSFLETVFEDGKLVKKTTLAEIRKRLWNSQ